jgi:hypothetical protein
LIRAMLGGVRIRVSLWFGFAPLLRVGLELDRSLGRVAPSLEVSLELGWNWIRVTTSLEVGLEFGWSCCRVVPLLEVVMEFGWSWVDHCCEKLRDSLGRATDAGGFMAVGCFGLGFVKLFCWELMVCCRSSSSSLFDWRMCYLY